MHCTLNLGISGINKKERKTNERRAVFEAVNEELAWSSPSAFLSDFFKLGQRRFLKKDGRVVQLRRTCDQSVKRVEVNLRLLTAQISNVNIIFPTNTKPQNLAINYYKSDCECEQYWLLFERTCFVFFDRRLFLRCRCLLTTSSFLLFAT